MEQSPPPADTTERFAAPSQTARRSLSLSLSYSKRLILLIVLATIAIGAFILGLYFTYSQTLPFALQNVKQPPLLVSQPTHIPKTTDPPKVAALLQELTSRPDGASGDFMITKTQNRTGITLSWDKTIRTYYIAVYNLGKPQTNVRPQPVLLVSYIKPITQAANSQNATQATPIPPQKLTTFITPPYTFGEALKDYYYLLPQANQSVASLLLKGNRYTIDISGLNLASTIKNASLTFTYE